MSTILRGAPLQMLRTLPDESIQAIVTSSRRLLTDDLFEEMRRVCSGAVVLADLSAAWPSARVLLPYEQGWRSWSAMTAAHVFIETLVRTVARRGDTILDPFVSDDVRRAALEQGRNFIGITAC